MPTCNAAATEVRRRETPPGATPGEVLRRPKSPGGAPNSASNSSRSSSVSVEPPESRISQASASRFSASRPKAQMRADMFPPNSLSACLFRTRFVRESTETENVSTGRFFRRIADEFSKARASSHDLLQGAPAP
jgi:hypothetical protein